MARKRIRGFQPDLPHPQAWEAARCPQPWGGLWPPPLKMLQGWRGPTHQCRCEMGVGTSLGRGMDRKGAPKTLNKKKTNAGPLPLHGLSEAGVRHPFDLPLFLYPLLMRSH